MEEPEKIRQLTQKEVSQIDANQVAYYTLTDGTIVRIKREDENEGAGQSQNEQQFLGQNQSMGVEEQAVAQNENISPEKYQETQNSIELNQINQQEQNTLPNEYQEQQQINQEENYQMNTNLNPVMQTQTENNQTIQSILQPGDNYGYYNSNARQNTIQNHQPQCTCAYQMPQGYLNYNANIINAQEAGYQMNQLGLNVLRPFGNQMYLQGQTPRRQLYKLVTAIPVKLSDVRGVRLMEQKTNSQIQLHSFNSNTYVVGNAQHQNELRRMGMGMNTPIQLYQNNYNQYMQNSAFTQQNNSFNQSGSKLHYRVNTNPVQKKVNRRIEQTQYSYQKEIDNNVQQFNEQEYQPDDNQENIEYCNCDLQYSDQSKRHEQNFQNIRKEDICTCQCDCGCENVKDEYELNNPKSSTQKVIKKNYNYNSREGYTK